MSALLDLQRTMRSALLAGRDTPPPAVIGGTRDAVARLRIYRNKVLGNLTGALRLTFPAIERLVGVDFFAAAADRFISESPPASADLYEYGAAFPDFLATFEPARNIAYLADVARLEWVVNQALHSVLTPALSAAALVDVPSQQQQGLRFAAHPSLSLLALTYPAKAIWEAVLTDDRTRRASSLAAIDLMAAGDILAVLHGTGGLALIRLSRIAYDFACALTDGRSLADALEFVPETDAAPLLGGFIAHGFFGHCDPPANPTPQQPGSKP